MPFLIPAQIDPPNTVCVQLEIPNDETYLANFNGLLTELGSWWNHERDDAHSGTRIAAHWRQVLDTMTFCAATTPDAGQCTDYPTSSSIIEWYPADPFFQPSAVPTGYLLPPWEIVTPDNLLSHLGYQVGDVLTEIYRLPPGSLPTILPPGGLPHFRIYASGTGTIELHLINIPLGGYAFVVQDDLVVSATLVDLNLETISIPPESEQDHVHEVVFTTGGAHHVDVTIVPYVNAEVIPLHYGGGVRKIVVCGLEITEVPPQFQVVSCILQWRPSPAATWADLVDLTTCTIPGPKGDKGDTGAASTVPGPVGPVGPIGPAAVQPGPLPNGTAPTSGECFELDVVLFGGQQYLLPVNVTDGFIINVTGLTGAANDGTPPDWNCPDGSEFILGGCDPAYKAHRTDDPVAAAYHMQLVLMNPALPGGGVPVVDSAPYTVPTGTGTGRYLLQVNDSALNNNQGTYQFHLSICAPSVVDVVVTPAALGYSYVTPVGAPINLHYGDTFTITSQDIGFQSGDGHELYYVIFMMDKIAKITIMSQTGWVLYYFSAGNVAFSYAPAVGANTINTLSSALPTFPTFAADCAGIGISSSAPFSVTFKVETA